MLYICAEGPVLKKGCKCQRLDFEISSSALKIILANWNRCFRRAWLLCDEPEVTPSALEHKRRGQKELHCSGTWLSHASPWAAGCMELCPHAWNQWYFLSQLHSWPVSTIVRLTLSSWATLTKKQQGSCYSECENKRLMNEMDSNRNQTYSGEMRWLSGLTNVWIEEAVLGTKNDCWCLLRHASLLLLLILNFTV